MSIFSSMMMALTAGAHGPMWHDSLQWRGQTASIEVQAGGGFLLHSAHDKRLIPAPPYAVQTASPLFDGLYAMAQDDLRQDSVSAIRDGAYDHDQPIPCDCFATGDKWPYVWTRDLSYSVDLGLWRYDDARSRNGLRFKLSDTRATDAPKGPYVMQDTGSGGSWPVSTDRVAWFLAARHLLDDNAFASDTWQALTNTLEQDRQYVFDANMGLYRGETSFLDWREQTYPAWTQDNVVFIAQSFSLSTNVLHYQALLLAARLAGERHDPRATDYQAQADALKAAINAHFWRDDRGMYMSYIGGDGAPFDTYDLLGIALAIDSGVADGDRARQTMANYPAWPAGSPVIWPERTDQPIYHNRAIWPFVSAYALRAARKLNDPEHIAFEIASVMRGAALAGSNMENYELTTEAPHVDDGKLSGPVVDSPRQLWSVAAYLAVVDEGVFGLENDGRIEPKLPVSLVPMLFGQKDSISLQLPDKRITLKLPKKLDGNLLVAGDTAQRGNESVVQLMAIKVPVLGVRGTVPPFAPSAPAAPQVTRDGTDWLVRSTAPGVLYLNGKPVGAIEGKLSVPVADVLQCFSLTQTGAGGLESLHSPAQCEGPFASVDGAWPRAWVAPGTGSYQVALSYRNDHGPISTGITAAVRMLAISCDGSPKQRVPIVMPHSVGEELSTTARFSANAGAHCSFTLADGFNMSDLAHNAHYTGGVGGSEGPLNDAHVGALRVVPLPTDSTP
ncbi:Six-hairpin glycosidase-like protein [Rhodanobacter sp. 7MK24]|uniref:alpha-L-rhamnosidase-related protein n=1 Tax=Rhodanobacter sp. 7MK24 TaxID=2775922 RepID=UPI0017806C89|nr:Six-hairpin glycosidase-like protein [Rhodanobacter sp. 7MK24]MBD8879997.1 Six-hairpin glycosidase-like protein [Rhodanobacter sp. 7MK24]